MGGQIARIEDGHGRVRSAEVDDQPAGKLPLNALQAEQMLHRPGPRELRLQRYEDWFPQSAQQVLALLTQA